MQVSVDNMDDKIPPPTGSLHMTCTVSLSFSQAKARGITFTVSYR